FLPLRGGIAGLVAGFYSGGLGLGVAAPLAAVTLALWVGRGPAGARLVGLLATVAATVAVGLAWYKHVPGSGFAGASVYSPLVGGTVRAGAHAITWVSLLKQIGFGAFPWIALLPLAAAHLFALLGRPAEGGEAGARAAIARED